MNSEVEERLVAYGFRPADAERKTELCERASLHMRRWGEAGQTRLCVPGRIEVLGKHTDYAGGRSLLCTVERGICVVVSRRSDPCVRIADAVSGQEYQFTLSSDLDA